MENNESERVPSNGTSVNKFVENAEEIEEKHSDLEVKISPSTGSGRPFLILFVSCFLALFFHPKFFNLRFNIGGEADRQPMNFVSNFYLWTRYNPRDPALLIVGLRNSLKESYFYDRKTYIIIHGFTRTGLDGWVIKMKDALLRRENCNVISTDWQSGSVTVGYYVIQSRVPAVGEDVAHLISFLNKDGDLQLKDVHLIGHSLGAHVAGFAGKALNGKLPRISGLDPAGLLYNAASDYNRLSRTDAFFVDVIHTHGCYRMINQFTDCYGTYENLGDADFWPNGGEHQPPCDNNGDGMKMIREGSNCDHGMAYVYYTASISYSRTSTYFRARPCDTWEKYSNGSCSCNYSAQYMGYNADPSLHGNFYLNTSETSPYALLDPECFSGEYSFLKISGVTLCIILSIIWGGIILSEFNPSFKEKCLNSMNCKIEALQIQPDENVHLMARKVPEILPCISNQMDMELKASETVENIK